MYYRASRGAFPVRWTAPEAMETMRFNIATDVWSYGILLLEIYLDGGRPYAGMNNEIVISRVAAGYRAPKPAGCSDSVYSGVMLKCWCKDPDARPSFAWLGAKLEQIMPAVALPRRGSTNISAADDEAEETFGFEAAEGDYQPSYTTLDDGMAVQNEAMQLARKFSNRKRQSIEDTAKEKRASSTSQALLAIPGTATQALAEDEHGYVMPRTGTAAPGAVQLLAGRRVQGGRRAGGGDDDSAGLYGSGSVRKITASETAEAELAAAADNQTYLARTPMVKRENSGMTPTEYLPVGKPTTPSWMTGQCHVRRGRALASACGHELPSDPTV